MIEPRLTSVILLDGSLLDFLISPEFLTADLIDMVSSNLDLHDKDYFGLSFIDSTGHRNWLQLEKKILDHDLPKKNGVLILFFTVKFFIESIAYTKDKVAVELFFWQARLLIYQADLETNNELIFELGALVLQALFGDYKNEKETIQHIKTQNILPKHFLDNYSQISSFCEPKIIAYYKKCSTMSRGQCIVNYLSIIEKLCNYGVHYYEVKDKTNTKWYLGISYRGIGLYEANNKIIPKKIFPWSKLENLYYRDRKFSIEVHESQTGNSATDCPNSDTNRTGLGQQNNSQQQIDESFNPVKVYAWFAAIPSLCKSIWLMAVAQHQFYLDKKSNRHNVLQFKSLNDLANELNNNSSRKSILSWEDEQNVEDKQITVNKIFMESKHSDESTTNSATGTVDLNAKTEMLNLYKKQKELLVKNLELKRKQYDEIKSKQNDINEITKRMQVDRSQVENLIKVLIDHRNNSHSTLSNNSNAYLDNLLHESEIKKKIMLISLNLASDPSASYTIQKQRREFYEKTKKKWSQLEKKIEIETKRKNGENLQFIDSDKMCKENNQNSLQFNNTEKKLKQIDEINSTEISPASIHRKDSYRRAQEQKLFLESNCNMFNKQNRFLAARKVKTLLNNELMQIQNSCSQNFEKSSISSTTSSSSSSSSSATSNNVNPNDHNLNGNRFITNSISSQNDFLSRKNFIPEESFKDGILVESPVPITTIPSSSRLHQHSPPSNHHPHLNENFVNDNHTTTTNNVNTRGGQQFYLNDDFLDLESSNHQRSTTLSNNAKSNGDFTTRNGNRPHHHLPNTTPVISYIPYNNGTSNSTHQISSNDINIPFVTQRRGVSQRKNTSDSNVKLLADHNFYHVTSNSRKFNQSQNPNDSSTSIENQYACNEQNGQFITPITTSDGIALAKFRDASKMSNQKSYELNDYFKYNSKFKQRGLNSSSNSLISLNSSSVGSQNEDSQNINSEKDLIRSNPDLKSTQIHSPNGLYVHNNHLIINGNGGTNLKLNNLTQSVVQPASNSNDQNFSNYPFKNGSENINNLSNNMSLNLSMHTAEEFSIEMLEWLNNEGVANGKKNAYLLDKDLCEPKMSTTNATLV